MKYLIVLLIIWTLLGTEKAQEVRQYIVSTPLSEMIRDI